MATMIVSEGGGEIIPVLFLYTKSWLYLVNCNFIDGFLHKFRYSARKISYLLTIQSPFKGLIEAQMNVMKVLTALTKS